MAIIKFLLFLIAIHIIEVAIIHFWLSPGATTLIGAVLSQRFDRKKQRIIQKF
jgi:hypothetical protein